MSKSKLNIKKILLAILWLGFAIATIVLLVAAVNVKNEKKCSAVHIEIEGVSNHFFIDKTDVLGIIKNYLGTNPVGQTVQLFDLKAIEHNLETDVWIKNAELFFDNNQALQVHIDEREPIARIFGHNGDSFYIDSSLTLLPLSEKASARIPVFTGFPEIRTKLTPADSNLLRNIKNISIALQADNFLMAMIEQVDITAQGSFEMIPKIGTQVILFGGGDDVANKLEKLRLFYKNVMPKTGWSKYSIVSLQYKNQVVAKIKDAADKSADSLRTLQLMQLIAERAASLAQDSSQRFAQDTERNSADSTMIMQSIEREEDISAEGNLPAAENMPPVNNNTNVTPKSAVVSDRQKVVTVVKVTTKGALKPTTKNSPKILMPKGNN
jgi:cell division protein FtsQ